MILKIGKFRIKVLEEITPSVASLVAAILSYIENDSILWAVAHYFCGFLYVIYWIFKKIYFLIF